MRSTASVLCLVLLSCGPTLSDDDADVTERDAPVATCTSPIEIPLGDPDGHPDPLSVPAAEARAGRLEASELPFDRTGLATWAAGDFVLANEHVAVIIEDVGPSDLFDPFGGKLVGIGLMEDGHIVQAADFEEIIFGTGLYTIETESVTVLHDGSDGGEAVIRSVGIMTLVPFLAEFAGRLFGDHGGLRVAIDHALAPGAHAVEVRFHLAPDHPGTYAVTRPVQVILQASRMPAFVEQHGFDTGVESMTPRLLFEDEEGASYAWESADGPLTRVIEAGGAGIYTSPVFSAEGCALGDHVYGRVTIAGPGLSPLRRVLADAAGETLRAIDVVVNEPDGTPADAVHVVARNAAGEVFVRARTDATGHAQVDVPNEAMTLSATREGQWLVVDQPLATTERTATLTLPAYGTIHVVTVDDTTGAALPSRVQVIPDVEPRRPEASFGEIVQERGRLHLVFPETGEVTLRVPPGVHRVVVSRGYEYELHDEEVTAVAGETAEVTARLTRSVDTPGMLSADFHIHTNRSPDAPDSGERKIRDAAAEGLEVPLRSDHDWVNDFDDEVQALGLAPYAFGVSSLELTTFVWGHFGVFPLEEDEGLPSGGAVAWAFRSPSEVFADAVSRTGSAGNAMLIVNHPRNGGAAGAAFAYFNAAGYDPVTGTAERADRWDDSFDVIEVFNDSAFDVNEPTTVRDWFSFLSAGRHMFAVGSSDSHLVSNSPVGYPRTWVDLGTDDPAVLRSMGAGALRDAVRAGHMTIGGGVFVTADVAGIGPGDTVTGAGTRASVHVVVSAPTWVDVDRLRVFVDGAMTLDTPITAADPIVRFDDVVDVDVATGVGSYVVVVATGDHDLDPVHPGRLPFGVTNPIFLVR
jgi:hypothetical protein